MTRRTEVLSRISGPHKENERDFVWEFVWRRNVGHAAGTVVARRLIMQFDPGTRSFKVSCRRRVSKRKKRVPVPRISRGLVAHLRSRLAPAELARCMREALAFDPEAIPF